jgi:hypothetical protein
LYQQYVPAGFRIATNGAKTFQGFFNRRITAVFSPAYGPSHVNGIEKYRRKVTIKLLAAIKSF